MIVLIAYISHGDAKVAVTSPLDDVTTIVYDASCASFAQVINVTTAQDGVRNCRGNKHESDTPPVIYLGA